MQAYLNECIWALCVQLYSLAETPLPPPPPPPAFGLIYEGALVSQDRRHLFVTPNLLLSQTLARY